MSNNLEKKRQREKNLKRNQDESQIKRQRERHLHDNREE